MTTSATLAAASSKCRTNGYGASPGSASTTGLNPPTPSCKPQYCEALLAP